MRSAHADELDDEGGAQGGRRQEMNREAHLLDEMRLVAHRDRGPHDRLLDPEPGEKTGQEEFHVTATKARWRLDLKTKANT